MRLNAGLITPLATSDSGTAAVWGSKGINPWPQSCLCLTLSGYPSNDDKLNLSCHSDHIHLGIIALQSLASLKNIEFDQTNEINSLLQFVFQKIFVGKTFLFIRSLYLSS